MKLTTEIAKTLLDEAEKMNPGQWVDHCINAGIVAKNIAAECPDIDEDKAQAFAMIHDIGRRNGISGMRHTLDGYNFLKESGYEDAARICLTHSHPTLNMLDGCGTWDCSDEEKEFVKNFLSDYQLDDYDKLCQLADALALATGPVILEKRLVNVNIRHGFNDYTLDKWKGFFEIKDYFDKKVGKNIYKLIPGIVENTFR